MSGIEFHCPHCNKLIKAPAGSGGKHGKCPSCGQSVYIPTPPDEIEEYGIAPLDEDEERRQQSLHDQTYAMERERLHDSTLPEEKERGGGGPSFPPPGSTEDIRDLVIRYLAAMMDSRLDEAEALVTEIRGQKKAAKSTIQQLSADSIPPEELSAMPTPLMHGFLKSLSSRL